MFLLHASFDTCTRQRWFFYVGTVNEWRSNLSILKIISYLYCHWQTFPASFKLTVYHPRFLRVFLVPLATARACLAQSSPSPRVRGGGGYSKKFYTGSLCPEVRPLPLWQYTSTCIWRLKKIPLSGGASPYRPLLEVLPPPPSPPGLVSFFKCLPRKHDASYSSNYFASPENNKNTRAVWTSLTPFWSLGLQC